MCPVCVFILGLCGVLRTVLEVFLCIKPSKLMIKTTIVFASSIKNIYVHKIIRDGLRGWSNIAEFEKLSFYLLGYESWKYLVEILSNIFEHLNIGLMV